MEEEIQTEKKLMSLLSHLSILIPNVGVLAPVIIWLTNKEKSRFVRFNALQAIFFQLIFLALMMVFMFVGIILVLVAIAIPWTNLSSNAEPGILFLLSMIFMFMYFPLWLIFSIYAVVASLKSFKGKIFRYAIIGRIIEKKVYKN